MWNPTGTQRVASFPESTLQILDDAPDVSSLQVQKSRTTLEVSSSTRIPPSYFSIYVSRGLGTLLVLDKTRKFVFAFTHARTLMTWSNLTLSSALPYPMSQPFTYTPDQILRVVEDELIEDLDPEVILRMNQNPIRQVFRNLCDSHSIINIADVLDPSVLLDSIIEYHQRCTSRVSSI